MEKKEFICIVCPIGCAVEAEIEGKEILKIIGNKCIKGKEFVTSELLEPKRVLTTTVKVKEGEIKLLPVKTDGAIPKEILFEAMREIRKIEVLAPIKINDIIVKNFLNTGVNLIATRSVKEKVKTTKKRNP